MPTEITQKKQNSSSRVVLNKNAQQNNNVQRYIKKSIQEASAQVEALEKDIEQLENKQ